MASAAQESCSVAMAANPTVMAKAAAMHRNKPLCPYTCSENTDALIYTRHIAYYELFTEGRFCGVKEPEDPALAPPTHLNLAFVNFGSNFSLIDEHSDWVRRAALTKLKYPVLRINIAIGGWAFNDPPTLTFVSEMAVGIDNRYTFVRSVVDYLRVHGLDGINIDREHPGATDRGGQPGDTDCYVELEADLREAFDREGAGWEFSCAGPNSYWYLRGFNVEAMQRYFDYFNLISYDIYGVWDQEDE
ncbi:hypothetical protein S7711_06835 [Stachybotrys chartarum IBT 7711]|uniref:chitinase n=1 Tax=Stachybotrys chartarum (strain CBS 109288 / IBT 7711) TaxID=1280523 RepID=A0A084B786_STACB|nr:hypothetical protein S7711_06835 [Stachybotrys chartarum IBT 7711]